MGLVQRILKFLNRYSIGRNETIKKEEPIFDEDSVLKGKLIEARFITQDTTPAILGPAEFEVPEFAKNYKQRIFVYDGVDSNGYTKYQEIAELDKKLFGPSVMITKSDQEFIKNAKKKKSKRKRKTSSRKQTIKKSKKLNKNSKLKNKI